MVTFLFTDIEGSTRRWEADAEAMRASLAAHDQVLRAAIEANGGFMFKHTGDGVCAAFTSPQSAVDAAISAQRVVELPVRMGIATGVAELREGDYFGTVLNRAARMMAAGNGGQILLAESTAGLLTGVGLVDLGPRRFRDLPTPIRVFQVRAEGLSTEIPPLRALDVPLGNLRPAASRPIGRDADLLDVAAAVNEHRLVTLTGVGGVGKTRLAFGVATELAEEFPDGVWVFELASVSDAVAVPDAVAAVLGVTQQPGKTVTQSVAAALEGRSRLLVFDNCEHVLDVAADLIEAILAQSTTVRVLATSREGLGVPNEQVWPVSSLDTEAGTDCAAVRLFVERARSVAPQFAVSMLEEADVVLTICRRLDGLPLAIELAASRMASMSAREVRDRLDDRFRLLVGSRRSLSRHQTLRHAVAWSYDLLDDAEKSLLAVCSVFTGGFDIESACAVTESGDDYAVLDRLDALVRKSLLVADRSSGHTRYSMLETIRQFAEEQLVASGEANEARTRHACYFAGREPDILALWDSPRQRKAYDWFTIELANLRTAFRWAADQGDLDTAAAITTYAMLFGALLANYEPLTWGEELIEPARAVDHPRLANLYLNVAQCFWTGRIEEAIRYAEAGQAVVSTGQSEVAFGLESTLGTVFSIVGQHERNVEWCRSQLAHGRDTHTLTRSLLVVALATAGDGEEARVVGNGMIEAAEATRNPWALANALYTYGYAFGDSDPPAALEAVRRGLVIAHESGNRLTESLLATTLSWLEAEHGDPLMALDHITLAVSSFYDSGNVAYFHFALATLALLLDRLGRLEPAAIIAGFALSPHSALSFSQFRTVIDHLRYALGEQAYDTLARQGQSMTTAEMVAYALDQIDQN